jgi:NitT/TauT family transport system ATP-binding protein
MSIAAPAVSVLSLSFTHTPRAWVCIDRLEIEPGTIVAIVGPTGCGKTTFLKLLAGLLIPNEQSRIRLNGADVQSAVAAGKVNFSFQAPVLLPWLTARDNVALPLRLRGITISKALAADIDHALRLVQLDSSGVPELYPDKLSSGMASRVAVAQALVSKCDLMLLDEVFGTLDEVTRIELDVTLRRMNDNRMRSTILFVTHSLDEALLVGDRILIFQSLSSSATGISVVADVAVKLRSRDGDVRYESDFKYQKQIIEAHFPKPYQKAA